MLVERLQTELALSLELVKVDQMRRIRECGLRVVFLKRLGFLVLACKPEFWEAQL